MIKKNNNSNKKKENSHFSEPDRVLITHTKYKSFFDKNSCVFLIASMSSLSC